MTDFELGLPVFDNGITKKNTWFLKEGSNVYRILPPAFSFAATGKWAVKYRLHKGVSGSNGRRYFLCPEVFDFENKRIVRRCPECAKIEEMTGIFEKQKAELLAKGKSLEQLAPLAEFLNFKTGHSLENRWHMNVLSQDNKIGHLVVPPKMKAAIDAACRKLMDRGINPIAADGGVWFNLEVSKNPSNFTAEPVTEQTTINGERYDRVKPAPLTAEVRTRMQTEGSDLSHLYAALTIEQVGLIVDSGYDPKVTDDVFGTKSKGNNEKVSSRSSESLSDLSLDTTGAFTTNEGKGPTSLTDEQFKQMFDRK